MTRFIRIFTVLAIAFALMTPLPDIQASAAPATQFNGHRGGNSGKKNNSAAKPPPTRQASGTTRRRTPSRQTSTAAQTAETTETATSTETSKTAEASTSAKTPPSPAILSHLCPGKALRICALQLCACNQLDTRPAIRTVGSKQHSGTNRQRLYNRLL